MKNEPQMNTIMDITESHSFSETIYMQFEIITLACLQWLSDNSEHFNC